MTRKSARQAAGDVAQLLLVVSKAGV